MLEALLESPVKEKALLCLLVNEDSYPSEIARSFGFNLNAVQYQLQKLEKAGVLSSRLRGKVRLYSLDPGCPFHRELQSLLQKALAALGDAERGKYSLLPAAKPEASPGAVAENRPQQFARPEKAANGKRPAQPVRSILRRNEPLDFSTD